MPPNEERYFNYPISFHMDFLYDNRYTYDRILRYCIYAKAIDLEFGTETQKVKAAGDYFGVAIKDLDSFTVESRLLFEEMEDSGPMVGLNVKMFWDFYRNDKTEYEKICLLAFLALKSIIQRQPFTKIDNQYWMSRMAGYAKSTPTSALPTKIAFYSKEYQAKKLKNELRTNWGLITYSRHTRGFYVSFKLTLEELVFQAEKRRKLTKEKQYKKDENEAIRKAMLRLSTM